MSQPSTERPAGEPTSPASSKPQSGVVEILAMAFPVIIAMASATLMQFADFYMVSRCGVAEAAAVAPAALLVFTFICFLSGAPGCTNAFVSQSFAKRDLGECSRYVWQALYLALVAGLAALVLWPVAPKLFAWIGHDPQLQKLECDYFRIRLAGVGTMAGCAALTGFFQGISRPRLTMYAALLANALNVFLNWVFIYGNLGSPALGVSGAGLATSIAAAFQFALLLGMFLSPRRAAVFNSRRLWRLSLRRVRGLVNIGLPAGVYFSLDMGIWTIFIALIVGRLSRTALAASNIIGQITQLSFMPTVGLSIAITALVGQNIGRKDLAAARARARTGMLLGAGYMSFMGLVFFVFRRQLAAAFLSEAHGPGALAEQEQVIMLAAQIMIPAALYQLFDALCIVSSGALKGAGDTLFPAVITVIYGLAFFLPLGWLLSHRFGLGAVGAWSSATAYIVALGLTLIRRWKSGRWETIDIFRTAHDA